MPTPEQLARQNIDAQLAACGWIVQDRGEMNLHAGRGVALREFPVQGGSADYMLFVDRLAAGVIEAKPEGTPLSRVPEQAQGYAAGHRPETLAGWLAQGETLRARLKRMAEDFPLITKALWPAQAQAIRSLETSLAGDRPRALIQMATGSGKTFTAVNCVYRLIKHARARRVLFLVDRNNLGRQAFKEFDQFVTPDDGRKFTELYNVQHLQSNVLDDVSKVHITTIQRLYSLLCGEAELDPALEESSLWEAGGALEYLPQKAVRYNPRQWISP
jgi:type I restriction enzyme, R subunit